tara:strand:- start:19 stop:528 length:510 start_codon:yes stop_codon:yes gene_type:complete
MVVKLLWEKMQLVGPVRCNRTKVWVKLNPGHDHPDADRNFAIREELFEKRCEIEFEIGCDGSACRAKDSKWVNKMEEDKPSSREMRAQVLAICNQEKVRVKSPPANSLLVADLNSVIREEGLCGTKYVKGCNDVGEDHKVRGWVNFVAMALTQEVRRRRAEELKKILDL